jgi:hypothetical protein
MMLQKFSLPTQSVPVSPFTGTIAIDSERAGQKKCALNSTTIFFTELKSSREWPFGHVSDIYSYTGNILRNCINIQYSIIIGIFPFHTYIYAFLV